jgi:bifunctional DNA-binding transcriptional regulator/antitoxin component of YhaV-PrlF toxin-antitoxin module
MPKQSLGLAIKVTQGGVIKLPKDMMDFAGIKDLGTVEVFADGGGIYIRTMEADEVCDICDMNNGKTKKIGDKKICGSCLNEIRMKAIEEEKNERAKTINSGE